MYEYKALCQRVIDGDTLELEVDLGFGIKKTDTFRLYGVDTPEMRGKTQQEKDHAQAARQFVKDLVFDGVPLDSVPLIIRTTKDDQDKYGRYLADIRFQEGGHTLSEFLINNGFQKRKDYV